MRLTNLSGESGCCKPGPMTGRFLDLLLTRPGPDTGVGARDQPDHECPVVLKTDVPIRFHHRIIKHPEGGQWHTMALECGEKLLEGGLLLLECACLPFHPKFPDEQRLAFAFGFLRDEPHDIVDAPCSAGM